MKDDMSVLSSKISNRNQIRDWFTRRASAPRVVRHWRGLSAARTTECGPERRFREFPLVAERVARVALAIACSCAASLIRTWRYVP